MERGKSSRLGNCLPGAGREQLPDSFQSSAIRHTVAEEAGSGELFGALDVGGYENCGLARFVRDGDFDGSIFVVTLAAAEAEAAFGNVIALDDLFVGSGVSNAGGEGDAGANVAPAIGFAASGKSGKRLRRSSLRR